MGMIHWIIDNKRYDADYLANANKAAAKADNEPTWTQAAWLVKIGPDGKPGTYLRGSDLGRPVETRPKKDGTTWEFDAFRERSGDAYPSFDPNDEKAARGRRTVGGRHRERHQGQKRAADLPRGRQGTDLR